MNAKTKKVISIIIMVVMVAAMMAVCVSAADTNTSAAAKDAGVFGAIQSILDSTVYRISNYIVITLAVLAIVILGIKWILAATGSSEADVNKIKKAMLSVIIALLIIEFAPLIMKGIESIAKENGGGFQNPAGFLGF